MCFEEENSRQGACLESQANGEHVNVMRAGGQTHYQKEAERVVDAETSESHNNKKKQSSTCQEKGHVYF